MSMSLLLSLLKFEVLCVIMSSTILIFLHHLYNVDVC